MLSVVIPVFNERNTIQELLNRVIAVEIPKEIIVVDDYSTDGTRELLREIDDLEIKLICQSQNGGKGQALRAGFSHVSGSIVIVQDADLEYDPQEYHLLIEPILRGDADVVYGSRFLGNHDFSSFSHYWGNRFLTWCTNVLYGSGLTDMETCYKAIRTEVLKKLSLTANRFDVEPEITAQLLLLGYDITEIPITYSGRDVAAGKKIAWHDGWDALACLLRYRMKPRRLVLAPNPVSHSEG